MSNLSIARHVDERTAHCLLCGAPRAYLGVFYPNDWKDFLPLAPAPAPGKVRTILYGLCDRCFTIPGVADQVERVLRRQGRAPLN